MKRIIKRILVNFYLLSKIDFFKLFKLIDKSSDQVLLLFPSYPKYFFNYMFSAGFINDFALLSAMIKKENKFKLLVGAKKTYDLKQKTIIHNLSSQYTFFNGNHHADSLLNYQAMLLEKGNKLIPSHSESKYWENKIYMHQKFRELGISHPKTIIVDQENPPPDKPDIDFPLLFKPAHSSGSTGIEKINNIKEYKDITKNTSYREYLIQEWIDMRRDIRLIYIGDELVLHYWRINKSNEWKPTSTGHGSSVDFESLPGEWMEFIFNEYKKLNLNTGAFDITWHKDDLSTKPYILEVSPSYMPNPAPVGKFLTRPYGEYKKAIWGKDAYYKHYINLVFEQKLKLLNTYDYN